MHKKCSKNYNKTHENFQVAYKTSKSILLDISVHALAALEVGIFTLLTNWLSGITEWYF